MSMRGMLSVTAKGQPPRTGVPCCTTQPSARRCAAHSSNPWPSAAAALRQMPVCSAASAASTSGGVSNHQRVRRAGERFMARQL